MESQKQTIKRDITNRFGMIKKTNQNIEINIISWNEGMKKMDIRVWSTDGKYPYKGITLDREEFYAFMDILSRVDPSLIDSKLDTDSQTESSSADQNNDQIYSLNHTGSDNKGNDLNAGIDYENEQPANEYMDYPEMPEENAICEHAS